MTTSSFLAALRAAPTLPLVFRVDGAAVSPGYHLTEVKRVAYETMDCGAQRHRWSETQFELWVPPLADAEPGRAPMAAGKFLRIVERVEAELPLQGDAVVRIFASLGGHPAALYDVEVARIHAGQWLIELATDRTRCKAAERRVAAMTGGCCGAGGDDPAREPADAARGAGCGCASPSAGASAVCCA